MAADNLFLDSAVLSCNMLEPTTGIEPVNLFLTKEALYLLSYVGVNILDCLNLVFNRFRAANMYDLERETRFELATSSLEG